MDKETCMVRAPKHLVEQMRQLSEYTGIPTAVYMGRMMDWWLETAGAIERQKRDEVLKWEEAFRK